MNEDVGAAVITVERPYAQGVTFTNYTTSDGTASAGGDYTPTSGTLRFADGERTKTFTVPIVDDGAAEDDEIVVLTLTVGPRADPIHGGAEDGSSAALTIVGNDGGVPGRQAAAPSPPGTPGGAPSPGWASSPGGPGGPGGAGAPGGPGGAPGTPTPAVGSPADPVHDGNPDDPGSDDGDTAGAALGGSERRGPSSPGDDGGGAEWLLPVVLSVLAVGIAAAAWKVVSKRRAAGRLP